MRILFGLIVMCWAGAGVAAPRDAVFPSIDGGEIRLRDSGVEAVLVVNTASQCAFTHQYSALQSLYDTYKDQGLIVLAVPSDDFNQELASAQDVKAFCEINFGLTLPMTDMLHVRGPNAHPFFKAVEAETGFVPRWNFNKVLLDGQGRIVGTWRSSAKPDSGAILEKIEKLLD